MRRPLFALIPVLCLLISSCAEDEEEPQAGYENVIYDGTVTDETLLGFTSGLEAGDPVASSSKAPTLDTPASGDSVPAGSIPTFTWHLGASSLSFRSSPSAAIPNATTPSHGDPYSGYATYLEFTTDMETPIVQVFTSELSWTPTADVWDSLAAVDEPIMVTLIGAEFEQDRIIQDGGPYAGSMTQFEVTP